MRCTNAILWCNSIGIIFFDDIMPVQPYTMSAVIISTLCEFKFSRSRCLFCAFDSRIGGNMVKLANGPFAVCVTVSM